ncbi:hypothetical protein C0J52_08280 [Blattella germanica]|nr:hypothetical protein C0J52_08280 [Blattella germanica]
MEGRKAYYRNPFPRPWMTNTGAAAAAGGSSKGLKGIVAVPQNFHHQKKTKFKSKPFITQCMLSVITQHCEESRELQLVADSSLKLPQTKPLIEFIELDVDNSLIITLVD